MIDLGAIQLDDEFLYRQLRQDLRDDWFPDPIEFRDYLVPDHITQKILENLDRNHGEYISTDRTLANVPKPDFTIRAALEAGLIDRAVYHAVCSYLSNWFDPLIPWFVFSHRKNITNPDGRYMFRRGIPAWNDFTEVVRASLRPGKVLLTTDLTNYFDNINITKLRDQMLQLIPQIEASAAEKNTIRSQTSFLFQCLKNWTFEAERGLPQNRDASSFLANIYMRSVDIQMEAEGFRYFRYMDDIRLVCDSKTDARLALQKLIVALRELGLAVNSKKTSIQSIADERSIASSIEETSPEMLYLHSLWESRQIPLIKKSFDLLKSQTLKCLQHDHVNTREFRFCIGRLARLAGSPEIDAPASYFQEISDLLIRSIPDNPAATDQFVAYLERVSLTQDQKDLIIDFMIDDTLNIYEWQSYRLWLFVGAQGIECERLKACALRHLAKPDGPSRAGAVLYLGAFGSMEAKIEIASTFSNCTSFLGQRAALIALQDVPFRPHIERSVQAHVRPDLVGSYRKLKQLRTGCFSPPKPISLTGIIDTERDYA